MFQKSMLIAAMFILSTATFSSANAERRVIGCDPTNAPGGVCVVGHQPARPIRDHRCPASQGGNCVGPEPAVIQCNDPRLCDNFGHTRPPGQPPIIIVDPINTDTGHFGISCRDGRNIVKQRGFRRVHAVDCSGDTFSYEGKKHGELYEISVNMRGDIVSVDSAY
jgi:hypothetical protein